MDPNHNQRHTEDQLSPGGNTGDTEHLRDRVTSVRGPDQAPPAPDAHRNTQASSRQPRYSDGYTLIPPNESQRNKMKTMAQKEEEELRKWKETHRPPPVHLNPEKLGGNVTLDEARQRQQVNLRCSKLQKKIKKEEDDKKRRQEEEEKQQQKKDEQRKKAERLEEKKRQEDQRRRDEFEQDRLRKQERLFQKFERTAPGSSASSSATRTPSRSKDVQSKQANESKSLREVELEHKRVNSAFLDKLQGRGRGSEKETENKSAQEAEHPCFAAEECGEQERGGHVPLAHPKPDPVQSCSTRTDEADLEAEYEWALMKLMNSFPDCNKGFLEDILFQCAGDYEQAHTLLICTLN